MKYIKGLDVKETPIKVSALDGNVELVDEQLRELGYKPYEEVVYEQAEKLNGLAPSEEDIKLEYMKTISVTIPEKGLPYMRGFSWQLIIVDNDLRYKLVPDSNGLGTVNNPILFAEYVKLLKNVYYFYEGNIYKYVGQRTDNAGSWDEVAADMEQI